MARYSVSDNCAFHSPKLIYFHVYMVTCKYLWSGEHDPNPYPVSLHKGVSHYNKCLMEDINKIDKSVSDNVTTSQKKLFFVDLNMIIYRMSIYVVQK